MQSLFILYLVAFIYKQKYIEDLPFVVATYFLGTRKLHLKSKWMS